MNVHDYKKTRNSGLERVLVIAEGGYQLIVLPSDQVFVVPLSAEAARYVGDQLSYELEAYLLIEAESIVYDLHVSSPKTKSLGFQSSQNQDYGAVAFVADGGAIRSQFNDEQLCRTIALTARASLVAQGFLITSALAKSDHAREMICLLIVEDQLSSTADVMLLLHQKVVEWRYCSSVSVWDTCKELVGPANTAPPIRVVCIGGCWRDKFSDPTINNIPIQQCQQTADELQAVAAQFILSGRQLPLINLAGPSLPMIDLLKPALSFANLGLASFVLFGVFLIGGMIYRAHRYRAETEQVVAQQETLFRELFPGEKLPVGLMSRFQSEHRRLRITKGSESRPKIPSVLAVFYSFLESLPSEDKVRFQIQNMRFERESLSVLIGNVATVEDLDYFRNALEQAGFSLPPIASRPGPQGIPLQWSDVNWKSSDVANKGVD